MKLAKATPADLPAVCAFYRAVCEAMERGGLDMWHWGEYPNGDIPVSYTHLRAHET